MKYLFSIVALIAAFASPALAGTQSSELGAEFGLNLASPNQMSVQLLGSRLIRGSMHSIVGKYKFSTQGGAIAFIPLVSIRTGLPEVLPKGAVIRNCVIDVITAPTSGGSATIAFGTGQTAVDLKAATAIASLTGLVACIPVGTAGTAIKLTADSKPGITVATAALTAGEINVLIDYTLSL